MKKYRFTLLFAGLLVIWLAAGPQIIQRLANQLMFADGLPAGVTLNGTLYYTQGFDGIWQVDMRSGSVGQWWQPSDGGLVTGIAASPDGSHLAIAYAPPAEEGFQTGTTDLYLSPVGAPDLQPVRVREMRNESYRNPAWSPDGAWLYYSHLRPLLDDSGTATGIQLQIERLRAEQTDSAPEVVLEGAEQPALSPDGTEIVFLKYDTRTYAQALWVAQVDGSQPRMLVPDGMFQALASPRFTTDGEGVLFSASGEQQSQAVHNGVVRAHGAPWDIWRTPLENTAFTKLTPNTLDGPWTAWSPEGQQMAVLAAEGVFLVHDSQFYRLAESLSEGEITWAPAR